MSTPTNPAVRGAGNTEPDQARKRTIALVDTKELQILNKTLPAPGEDGAVHPPSWHMGQVHKRNPSAPEEPSSEHDSDLEDVLTRIQGEEDLPDYAHSFTAEIQAVPPHTWAGDANKPDTTSPAFADTLKRVLAQLARCTKHDYIALETIRTHRPLSKKGSATVIFHLTLYKKQLYDNLFANRASAGLTHKQVPIQIVALKQPAQGTRYIFDLMYDPITKLPLTPSYH